MSVLEPPPGTDTVEEIEESVAHVERPPMGKWGAAGMPLERSKDFKRSTSRLLARLRPEWIGVSAVLAFALMSVTLLVLGPRILGHATNIIQGLALAKYQLQAGEGKASADQVAETLREAQRLVSNLLGDAEVQAGQLRREIAAETSRPEPSPPEAQP